MSVSLSEVLRGAGYDVENNVDDARWLLAQQDEFLELSSKAEALDDEYADYEDCVEQMEEDGVVGVPTFDEWRQEAEMTPEEV